MRYINIQTFTPMYIHSIYVIHTCKVHAYHTCTNKFTQYHCNKKLSQKFYYYLKTKNYTTSCIHTHINTQKHYIIYRHTYMNIQIFMQTYMYKCMLHVHTKCMHKQGNIIHVKMASTYMKTVYVHYFFAYA